jgi:hypothetical protein
MEPANDVVRNQGAISRAVRWISILPVGAVAAYTAWLGFTVLNRVSMFMVGFDPDSFVARAYTELTGSCAMGAAFVYFGARLAPSHRAVVAFTLCGVAVAAAGLLIYPALITRDWWPVFANIAMGAGAVGVTWSIHAGELDVESVGDTPVAA